MQLIDLRSDTVTKPTEGMRQAMVQAKVGDDVYDEDPTVNRLQEMGAQLLGKEAGLFVASGTMGNLVAALTHGGRGDEMILGNLSHAFLYEGGSAAGLAGIHPYIVANMPDGTLPIDRIEEAIRGDNVHFPHTRLISLENTHNRCGGRVLGPNYCDTVGELAHRHGSAVHLDGARLFNAATYLGVDPAVLTRSVDSVMVCLSKGLGAPVGSLLCGTSEFIREAKRMRKLVGGGMRQVGIIAAAGIYALEHHIDRLAEDHANARHLTEGMACLAGLTCGAEGDVHAPVQTNLVYFSVDGTAVGTPSLNAQVLSERLYARGILTNPIGSNTNQMRMVTHLDISCSDIEVALGALRSSLKQT